MGKKTKKIKHATLICINGHIVFKDKLPIDMEFMCPKCFCKMEIKPNAII